MKKILLALCTAICVFALTACGSTFDKDTSKMDMTIGALLTQCQTIDQDAIDGLKEVRAEELDLALIQYGIPCDSKAYIGILQSWLDAQDEMGAFIDVGEFTYSEQNGEILAEAEATYEDRDATMTFTFNETTGDVKAVSIGAHYTTGEILKKSGLNTIVGMGIVFIVLIFIAIIIWLMGLIMKGTNKPKAAPAVKKEEAPAPVAAAVPAAETDDLELVAVISAAIAASSGASSDSFVVRSIRKRSGKWNRA